MWRDERKGELSNGEERLGWVSERGGGSFLGSLVSDRSHDSTTVSKFLAFFSSSMSEYFAVFLSSPSWIYAMSVAHVSRPSNIWVAYTMVASLCSHSSLKKSRRSILVTTSRSTVISSSKSTYNGFRCINAITNSGIQ